MSARWWTFLVWALVAASALFWGLRLFVTPAALPARTTVASTAPPIGNDLSRLFGVDAPEPPPQEVAESPAESRFQLIGVVAAQPRAAAREGVALIAVDGRAAKAFRVGAVVEGQTILKAVAARGATLDTREGGTPVNLTLEPLPPPATGTLPGADGSDPGQAPGFPAPAPRPALAGPGSAAAGPAGRLPAQPFQQGQARPVFQPGQPAPFAQPNFPRPSLPPAMGPQTPAMLSPPNGRRLLPPTPVQPLEPRQQEVDNATTETPNS